MYDVLEDAGLEVYLVNARDTTNLPGRKSDVQESQWLLKLHTYGLLRNSFRPISEIRVLRTYWRQRAEHIHTATECVQRMQKALTQMNLQLANVISDIMGVTGQTILRAILAGERDAEELAKLRMQQSCTCRYVRGAPGNRRPYRDKSSRSTWNCSYALASYWLYVRSSTKKCLFWALRNPLKRPRRERMDKYSKAVESGGRLALRPSLPVAR